LNVSQKWEGHKHPSLILPKNGKVISTSVYSFPKLGRSKIVSIEGFPKMGRSQTVSVDRFPKIGISYPEIA
jgi:hypothetical protein